MTVATPDIEAITAQARDIRFGRTLLTILASIFFAIGWCFGAAWLAIAWACVAIKLGFQEGRRKTHQRQ